MDQATGKIYTREQMEQLPEDVQRRLVPVPPHKMAQYRKTARERHTQSLELAKRREKNKRAKKSRKRNR